MLWINSCLLYATSYKLFRQTTKNAVQWDMTWTNSEIPSFYICRFENFKMFLTVQRAFPHACLNSHFYFMHLGFTYRNRTCKPTTQRKTFLSCRNQSLMNDHLTMVFFQFSVTKFVEKISWPERCKTINNLTLHFSTRNFGKILRKLSLSFATSIKLLGMMLLKLTNSETFNQW